MNRSDFFRGVSYAGGGIVGLPAQQMYGMAQGGLADMGYAGGGYIPSYASGSSIAKWIKRAAQAASQETQGSQDSGAPPSPTDPYEEARLDPVVQDLVRRGGQVTKVELSE